MGRQYNLNECWCNPDGSWLRKSWEFHSFRQNLFRDDILCTGLAMNIFVKFCTDAASVAYLPKRVWPKWGIGEV